MTIRLTPNQCAAVIAVYCHEADLQNLPEPSHVLEMGDIGKLYRLEFPRTQASIVALAMCGLRITGPTK